MGNTIIIYYDYECSFCYSWCNRIKKILCLKNMKLRSIQSNETIKTISITENSWIIEDLTTGKLFLKSQAWWKLIRESPFSLLFYISYIPGVILVGDKIYTFIANNRPKKCNV